MVLRNKNTDILKVLPPIGSADYLFPAAKGQVLTRAVPLGLSEGEFYPIQKERTRTLAVRTRLILLFCTG